MTTNSSSDVGSSTITTLGTISTGTWNATTLDVSHGGTNNTTFTAYSVICAGTTSTGTFQNVSGVGSSTNVLTSNGAGALPTWQALAGGTSGLTKIVSITASNQASVDFDSHFSSSYNVYLFTFTNVIPVTNATFLYSRVGTGATPTWTATGYYWSSLGIIGSRQGEFAQNDSQAVLSQNASTHYIPNTNGGISGYLYIHGPNNSSQFINGNGRFAYLDTGSTFAYTNIANFFNSAANYTSIQFYFNTGNVSSGTICMYGVTP